MTAATEPVIITTRQPLRWRRRVALADVVVTGPGRGSVAAQCADLFACYPGLTLAVLPTRTGVVVVGVRDGTMLVLPRPCSTEPSPDILRAVAVVMYACWATGADPAWVSGAALTASTGLRVHVCCWDAAAAARIGGVGGGA